MISFSIQSSTFCVFVHVYSVFSDLAFLCVLFSIVIWCSGCFHHRQRHSLVNQQHFSLFLLQYVGVAARKNDKEFDSLVCPETMNPVGDGATQGGGASNLKQDIEMMMSSLQLTVGKGSKMTAGKMTTMNKTSGQCSVCMSCSPHCPG